MIQNNTNTLSSTYPVAHTNGNANIAQRLHNIRKIWHPKVTDGIHPKWEELVPNLNVLSSLGIQGKLAGPIVSFIFDVKLYRFAHISENALPFFSENREALLQNGLQFLFDNMSKETSETVLQNWERWSKYFATLSDAERVNYQTYQTFSVVVGGTQYWYQMILTPLHLDDNNDLVYSLGYITELLPGNKEQSIEYQAIIYQPDGKRRIIDISLEGVKPVKMSQRQRDIVQLMLEGLSSKEISQRLGISVHTVNNHRTRLKAKTGSKNTAHLAKYLLAKDKSPY